jgi:hypothetical protein
MARAVVSGEDVRLQWNSYPVSPAGSLPLFLTQQWDSFPIADLNEAALRQTLSRA